MKKLLAIALLPNIAFCAITPPQDGSYVSKYDGENYCIEVQGNGEGVSLYSEFGEEFCLPNFKESKNDFIAINQFRCVQVESNSYSEGFIGTFTKNSITITGTSDIVFGNSSIFEQSDYFFQKKYSFKLDTKGICPSARKAMQSDISKAIQPTRNSRKKDKFN